MTVFRVPPDGAAFLTPVQEISGKQHVGRKASASHPEWKQKMGLAHRIEMASLGTGHTSAILDLKRRTAYVGKA